MNFKQFLDTVRLYWRIFTAVTAAVLAFGLIWLFLAPLQYVSTAQLLISVNGSTTANAYQNDTVVASRVNSYVALLTSDAVTQRVVDKLGSKLTAQELASTITAVQIPNTAVIDIAATAPSADEARRHADIVAEEFVGYAESIEAPTGEDAQKVTTMIVSSASQPRSRLVEKLALGGLISLLAVLLGSAAVWLAAVTDRVIRTPWRAAAVAGVPVLGEVTVGSADLVAEAESYRRLRTRLMHLEPDGARVIQLSPADPGIDALQVAVNLCRAFDLVDGRCVIVDAVTKGAKAGTAPNVFAFNAWAALPERSSAKAIKALFDQLRQKCDRVIIAMPDVDPSALTDFADSVILLAEQGWSDRGRMARAAKGLKDVDGRLSGVVLVTNQGNGSRG